MAHKTFISYKFSDSEKERDEIIEKLGDDASYYTGENSDSKDMSENEDSTIWKNLRDKIFPTTVTIVIMSGNINQSNWVDKEITYSIGRSTRGTKQSQPNRVIKVNKDDAVAFGKVFDVIYKKSDYIEVSYPEFIDSPSEYIDKAPDEEFAKDKFDKIDIQYEVELDATVHQNGFRDFLLSQINRTKILKIKNNKKLIFEVQRGNMPREEFNKCEFYWKVRNYGFEAKRRRNERGQIAKGTNVRNETADFSGNHFVEVYLVKNNVVIARSKIKVPIDVINGMSQI